MADLIFAEVAAELEHAMEKLPSWPTDPLHALAILGEEYGELTKAMLQLAYEPDKSSHEHVRKEAIQMAAMAIRLLQNLDRYRYEPSEQYVDSPAWIEWRGGGYPFDENAIVEVEFRSGEREAGRPAWYWNWDQSNHKYAIARYRVLSGDAR